MTSTAAAHRDPADRGGLDIDPVVLHRIVEHAADLVPGPVHHGRRLAGIDVGGSGSSERVTVGAAGPVGVDVRLHLTPRYPGPVRAVIDSVRARVAPLLRRRLDEDLERLAGHHAPALAVTVSGRRTAPTPVVSRLR